MSFKPPPSKQLSESSCIPSRNHPWSSQCSMAAVNLFTDAFPQGLKLYAPLYILPVLVMGSSRRRFLLSLIKAAPDSIRSALFLATFSSSFCAFGCLLRRYFSSDSIVNRTAFLPGFLAACVSIVIESPNKHSELAAFCMNNAIETYFKLFILGKSSGTTNSGFFNSGLVEYVKRFLKRHSAVLLFASASAVLKSIYKSPVLHKSVHPDCSGVRKLPSSSFGGSESNETVIGSYRGNEISNINSKSCSCNDERYRLGRGLEQVMERLHGCREWEMIRCDKHERKESVWKENPDKGRMCEFHGSISGLGMTSALEADGSFFSAIHALVPDRVLRLMVMLRCFSKSCKKKLIRNSVKECCHVRNVISCRSCFEYACRGFVSGGTMGMAISASFSLLSLLKPASGVKAGKHAKSKNIGSLKMAVDFICHLLTRFASSFNWKTPLFWGLSSFLSRYSNCTLRKSFSIFVFIRTLVSRLKWALKMEQICDKSKRGEKDDDIGGLFERLCVLTSGFIGGLSMAVAPSMELAMYMVGKCIEKVWRMKYDDFKTSDFRLVLMEICDKWPSSQLPCTPLLKYVEKAMEQNASKIVFALSCSILFHASIFKPVALRKSYYTFLKTMSCGKISQVKLS